MPGGPEFEGQNTWKMRSEGQITWTTFLEKWTRLQYLVGTRLPGRGQKWARLPGRGQLGRGGGGRGAWKEFPTYVFFFLGASKEFPS